LIKNKTSNHLIAYFDILGYENIVNNLQESEEQELITDIKTIIIKLYKMKRILQEGFVIKTYSFSDNFLITMKIDDKENFLEEFYFLVELLQEIQYEIVINHGLLIRGGLVKGQLYTGKNFVFGKGLIQVCKIERDIAIFPRIVVDKKLLIDILPHGCDFISEDINLVNIIFSAFNKASVNEFAVAKGLSKKDYNRLINIGSNIKLQKDIDNNFIINYYQQIELLRHKKNLNIKNIKEILLTHIIFVINNLNINKNNNKIVEKYLWCCSYYNIFCKENGYPDLTIDIDELRCNYKRKNYDVFELINKNTDLKKISSPFGQGFVL